MSTTYKLTYFNVKALAEPIRLIFAYAKVPFEDNRVPMEKWAEVKPNYPWGSLPVLEVDGKVLAQSRAIVRYLSKQFNIAGDNDFESAKCDEMVGALDDFRNACRDAIKEDDNSPKKKEMVDNMVAETFPKYLGKWEEIVQKNGTGFLVGKKLSYADICVACLIQIYNENLVGGTGLDKYPGLSAHQEAVFNAPGIKEWVQNRPDSKW